MRYKMPFVRLAIVFVAICVVWYANTSQALDLQPLDPGCKKDNFLIIPELNLSIEAPNSNWKWLENKSIPNELTSKMRIFICQDGNTVAQFSLVIAAIDDQASFQQTATSYNAGVADTLKNGGWIVSDTKMEPSNLPLSKSYRICWTAVNPSGQKMFYYSYIGFKGRLFSLQHLTTENSEPVLFRKFVESFKLVGAPKINYLQIAAEVHLVGSILILLLFWGIGLLVNQRAGHIVFNPWIWPTVIILVSAVALSIFWIPTLTGNQAYLLGSTILGPFIFPLFFGFWKTAEVKRQRFKQELTTANIIEEKS